MLVRAAWVTSVPSAISDRVAANSIPMADRYQWPIDNHGFGKTAHMALQPHATLGSSRIPHGEDRRQERDGTQDGAVEKLSLRSNQTVVLSCIVQCGQQCLQGHGLLRERKMFPSLTAAIASSRSDCPVRRTRTVSGNSSRTREKLGTAHHRHSHVRDDHLERFRKTHQRQCPSAAFSNVRIEVAAQPPPEPFQNPRLIVNTDDPRIHLPVSVDDLLGEIAPVIQR